MRVRFLIPKSQKDSPLYHPGLKNNWKKFYRAPWPLIYHILELFCLISFYFFVSTPTIDFCFLNRQVFVDAFYPDYDYPDEPISTLDEITDYFESVIESIDSFINDSFMDIHISTRNIDTKNAHLYRNIVGFNKRDIFQKLNTTSNISSKISEEIDWPVLCEILFLNGTRIFTELNLDEMDFDLSFFYHLSYITISVDFYVFSKSPNKLGCSRWQIQSKIYAKDGFSQFSIIPSISRIQCNRSFIATKEKTQKYISKQKKIEMKLQNQTFSGTNSKSETTNSIKPSKKKARETSKLSFRREIQKIHKRRLRKKLRKTPKYTKPFNLRMKLKNPLYNKSIFHSTPTSPDDFRQMYKSPDENRNRLQKKLSEFSNDDEDDDDDDDQLVYQNALTLYRKTRHYSIDLLSISVVHLIVLCCRFRSQFRTHIELTLTKNDYRAFPTITQFHFTIGYWPMIDFISTVVVIAASVYLYIDTTTLTQFPSEGAIEFLSVAMFISFIRASQWLGIYQPFYQLTIILREAFMRLFYLVVGILPIVTGLSLFGILFFGFIEDSYETFRYLVQRMITSGMGDSIDDFFIITDDGTQETAWLSFFYVGIITALGMWIVFTSCIATVSYIHQNYIVAEDSHLKDDDDSDILNNEEILMN